MTQQCRVAIRSHHLLITDMTPAAREVVKGYLKRFILHKTEYLVQERRYVSVVDKLFAVGRRDLKEYRLHINTLPEFREHLALNNIHDVEWYHEPLYETDTCTFRLKNGWVPLEKQVVPINFVLSPDGNTNKCVGLQPGAGKSFISMYVANELRARVGVVVQAKYLLKWHEDIMRMCDIDADKIMVVQGSKHLMALLELARLDELDAEIVLFSNATLREYFKLYRDHGEDILEMGYACLPDQMFKHLKLSYRIIDEGHLDFHFNFLLDLYTHVPKSVMLSATLLDDNPFVSRMQYLAYPKDARYVDLELNKYVNAYAWIYGAEKPDKIKCTNYQRQYSHAKFEQSIMRNNAMLKRYLELIQYNIQCSMFVQDYQHGDRAIVFCYTIKMATLVADYLKKMYSGYEVRRYVDDDPFEALSGEIIVSTLQNAGTAVDIEQLTTVICTTAVKSSKANIQGFGRLRELKKCKRRPEFWYWVCEDIRKHRDYNEEKKKILMERAANFRTIPSGRMI